jgi:hypothetical protein
MERASRQLLLFSLAGFVAVVALGTVRASPAHVAFDTSPEIVRSLQSFHAHFDSLVWLGAAALGGALRLLAPAYRGPRWAPRLLVPAYAAGSIVFSGSYAVKAVGLRFGMALLARPVAPALASIGGLLLLGAAGCVTAIGWAVLRAAPLPDTQTPCASTSAGSSGSGGPPSGRALRDAASASRPETDGSTSGSA